MLHRWRGSSAALEVLPVHTLGIFHLLLTPLPGWEIYIYTKTISMPLYRLVEIT